MPAAANQRRPFSNRLLHPDFFPGFGWGDAARSPMIGVEPPVNIGLGSSEQGLVEGDKATRFAVVHRPSLFSVSPDFFPFFLFFTEKNHHTQLSSID